MTTASPHLDQPLDTTAAGPLEPLSLRDVTDRCDRAMLWLAAGFMLLSPISMASQLPFEEPAKYLRLACVLGVIWLGMRSAGIQPLGPATRMLLAFVAVFWLAALWSSSPWWGLFHKGQAFAAVLAGASLARGFRSDAQAWLSLRALALVLGGSAALLLYASAGEGARPATERFDAFGMNPNLLGNTAASYLLIVGFVALHETRGLLRTTLWVLSALLVCVILTSGSRGAVVVAIIGLACVTLPMARRPAAVLVPLLAAGALAYILMEYLQLGGTARLTEQMKRDTRSGIWHYGWNRFMQSPLLGNGWNHSSGSRWATVQSAWLQVAVETGVLGLAILAAALSAILAAIRRTWAVADSPAAAAFAGLSIGLALSMLGSGIFENSVLVGTSTAPFLLGVAVALMERQRYGS